MATTATPYGLKAVNHVGGTPYAGSTRLLPIASGYASNLFNGQVVQIATGGTVELVTTFGEGVVGVFVGCTYTDPSTQQLTFNNKWPTGTVAADAKAYIVDDPDVIYMAQADGSVTQADLGQNSAFAAPQSTTTGSTQNGNSTSAVESTTAATDTLPFRIVDFVDSPTSTVGDAFTDVLIKFNAGIHSYNNPTGI
tara:strand:+ start:654 stop:1238 length:585 start_codon:yes stop_codon:yes gene_type:complete